MTAKQPIILKTFNTQFEGFLNEMLEIFPDNLVLMTTKNSLLTLKKFDPKLLIGVWYRNIWMPYKNDISTGDVKFFIEIFSNSITKTFRTWLPGIECLTIF